MEYYGLENYFSFACLAGACPSTCCAGWSIQVDEQDYHRFCQLARQDLRKDILSHIEKRDGRYFFQNRRDGSCAMLDEDGLCRIQRNSSQETLCNTCRKYPRLFRERQGVYYFSMAASCPVISRALWQGQVSYVHRNASGRICQVEGRKLSIAAPVWDYYYRQEKRVSQYRQRIARKELFWDSMGGLFGLLIEIFPQLAAGERKSWEELALFYSGIPEQEIGADTESCQGCWPDSLPGEPSEDEMEEKITDFLGYDTGKWRKFIYHYLTYRFMSRQAIYEEMPEETFCHSLGEVFLVQAACFLEFLRQGTLQDETVCDWIQRVYRLCAHGRERERKIKQIFCDFYQEKSLWILLTQNNQKE